MTGFAPRRDERARTVSRVECSGRADEHTREVDHERTRGKRTHARAAERAPHGRTTWAHARTTGANARTTGAHARTTGAHARTTGAHARTTGAHARTTGAHARTTWLTSARSHAHQRQEGTDHTVLATRSLIYTHAHTHTQITHTHTHVQGSFNTSDVVHEYVRD